MLITLRVNTTVIEVTKLRINVNYTQGLKVAMVFSRTSYGLYTKQSRVVENPSSFRMLNLPPTKNSGHTSTTTNFH